MSRQFNAEDILAAAEKAAERGRELPMVLVPYDIYRRINKAIEQGAEPPSIGFHTSADAIYWLYKWEQSQKIG